MLVCGGEMSFRCSRVESKAAPGETRCLRFSVFPPASPSDIKELFSSGDFYFWDDVLKGRLPDTDNVTLIGIGITYDADLTIKIKLKYKGDN